MTEKISEVESLVWLTDIRTRSDREAAGQRLILEEARVLCGAPHYGKVQGGNFH